MDCLNGHNCFNLELLIDKKKTTLLFRSNRCLMGNIYSMRIVRTGSSGNWFWRGISQPEPMDLAVDLWIDSLDALAVCFLYDEFSHE